eukprot:gene25435-biopygen10508
MLEFVAEDLITPAADVRTPEAHGRGAGAEPVQSLLSHSQTTTESLQSHSRTTTEPLLSHSRTTTRGMHYRATAEPPQRGGQATRPQQTGASAAARCRDAGAFSPFVGPAASAAVRLVNHVHAVLHGRNDSGRAPRLEWAGRLLGCALCRSSPGVHTVKSGLLLAGTIADPGPAPEPSPWTFAQAMAPRGYSREIARPFAHNK